MGPVMISNFSVYELKLLEIYALGRGYQRLTVFNVLILNAPGFIVKSLEVMWPRTWVMLPKTLVALPKTKSQVAQFFLSFVKTPGYSKSLRCC